MNAPLDDHAAMYLAASRLRHPPCIGVVRYFDERVADEMLAAYAGQLASNPIGFGRRVVPPRVPGARPRWQAANDLPPLRVEPEPVGPRELAEVLDEEVSTQPDPSRGAGWRLAAVTGPDGGSVILTWLHHSYGDGRGILETAFAPPSQNHAPPTHTPVGAIHELGDVFVRVRDGVAGSVRLGREAALIRWRAPGSDLGRLRPTVAALSRRHRTVGTRSERRIVTLARADADAWDGTAAARGGSGNTLLIAVVANLLRLARRSRGEMHERPLRVLVPVDTRRLPLAGQSQATAAANAVTANATAAANAAAAAIVNLPGRSTGYGQLDEVRAATREALHRAAVAMTAASAARTPRPAGIVDAMQLLPNAITYRVASRVQASADGVASNIGPIPAPVAKLGPYTAREMFLLASPMLTDVTVCLGRHGTDVTLGVVADPARLGPGAALRDAVEEELAAWGLEADVR
jgi:hypothetical protein